jgi:hypothetical protein
MMLGWPCLQRPGSQKIIPETQGWQLRSTNSNPMAAKGATEGHDQMRHVRFIQGFILCCASRKNNPRRTKKTPGAPKGTKKGPKREPRGAEGDQKGAKRGPKGKEKEPRGAKGAPKGSLGEPKGSPKGVGKQRAERMPKWRQRVPSGCPSNPSGSHVSARQTATPRAKMCAKSLCEKIDAEPHLAALTEKHQKIKEFDESRKLILRGLRKTC